MSRGRARSPLQPGHVESALRPDRARTALPVVGAPLLSEQAVRGNQAVQRRLADAIQAKLEVNAPGDAYEQEADRMAEEVMRAPEKPGAGAKSAPRALQRKAEPKKDEKPKVQKKADPKKEEKPKVQKKADPKKDEKPKVQKKAEPKKDEKPKVQKKADARKDDEKVQRKPEPKKEEKPKVQKKAEAAGAAALDEERREEEGPAAPVPVARKDEGAAAAEEVPAHVEEAIRSRLGAGEPLPKEHRAFFEARFGHDLRDVRIHTDAESQRAARALNAQAFTVGRDIFFAPGRFAPDTAQGRRLLAHEITHTLQQAPAGPPAGATAGASVHGKAPAAETATAPAAPTQDAASAPGAAPASGPASFTPAPTAVQRLPEAAEGRDPKRFTRRYGRLTEDESAIEFDAVKIPTFKYWGHRRRRYNQMIQARNLKRPRNYRRVAAAPEDQRAVWERDLRDSSLESHVSKLRAIAQRGRRGQAVGDDEEVVFKLGRGIPAFFPGNLRTVARNLLRPPYNREGRPKGFHVDHVVELQLGGTNDPSNMELLAGQQNQASGDAIQRDIVARVEQFLTHLTNDPAAANEANVRSVKQQYELRFARVDASIAIDAERDEYWTRTDMQRGRHIDGVLQPSGRDEMEAGPDEFFVFRSESAGIGARLRTTPGEGEAQFTESFAKWFKPFRATQIDWTPDGESQVATVRFALPDNHPQWKDNRRRARGTTTLTRLPGAPRAAVVDMQRVRAAADKVEKKGASPITVSTVEDTEDGLAFHGQIVADIPLVRGTAIDFSAVGDDVTFSKTFTAEEFAGVPRPLRVTGSSLTIAASTGREAFRVSGRADFGIDRLGTGYVQAAAGTRGFDVEGGFQFDPELFDPPAEVTLRYRDERFSMSGTLGISSERVRGVRQGTITVGYENGVFSATGSAELDVPGVEQADVRVTYSEEQGLAIAGSAALSANPVIESGRLEATVRRSPEGTWGLSARGTARPRIPGVSTELTAAYEDGAMTIEATGRYSRGMLSGTLTVGATNRPIGADGRPSGAPAANATELRPYGGGSMTVRFSPWLQGTVGVRVLPNGEIELTGGVAVPQALNLFDEKRYERNVFSIGLDIPIVGVAVAGQRIGIFATVQGGLDLSASVGPGQLQDTALTVQYNPSREADTRVHGTARLHVPAQAGLRLFVRGGLGAGIPVVSATAGLEIGGRLGLEAAASLGVQVEWTPARGIVLEATPEITVQPKMRFDVSGYVDVSADLLLTTVELYHRRFELAAFEFGSDLRFGMRLPIRYEENRDFDVSWNQVEFTVPQINTDDVLKSIIRRVA